MSTCILREIPELEVSIEQVVKTLIGEIDLHDDAEIHVPTVETLIQSLLPNYEKYICPLTFKEEGVRTYEYQGKFYVYEIMATTHDRREFETKEEMFNYLLKIFRRFLLKEFKMRYHNYPLSMFHSRWEFSEELVLKLLEESLQTARVIAYYPRINLPETKEIVGALLIQGNNILSREGDISDGIHLLKLGSLYFIRSYERGIKEYEESFQSLEHALESYVKARINNRFEIRKIFTGMNHLEYDSSLE